MLAMPILAVGQPTPTTPGMSGSGTRMEQPGRQETAPEQIREAQKQLKESGFYRGSIDGQLGPQTKAAIREYQKSQGLPQTGQLDEPTKELLMVEKTQQAPGRMEFPRGPTPRESMPGGRTPGSTTPGESPR